MRSWEVMEFERESMSLCTGSDTVSCLDDSGCYSSTGWEITQRKKRRKASQTNALWRERVTVSRERCASGFSGPQLLRRTHRAGKSASCSGQIRFTADIHHLSQQVLTSLGHHLDKERECGPSVSKDPFEHFHEGLGCELRSRSRLVEDSAKISVLLDLLAHSAVVNRMLGRRNGGGSSKTVNSSSPKIQRTLRRGKLART